MHVSKCSALKEGMKTSVEHCNKMCAILYHDNKMFAVFRTGGCACARKASNYNFVSLN